MATPHVPVSPELALPWEYAHVQGYLDRHDPDLRLRRSAERPGLYILERRLRRRPAGNLGMQDLSDMHVQKRDGYIHVATTHPSFLDKPWNIIRALQEEGADLFAKTADEVEDEEQYEKRWHQETRRRRRLGLYRDIASEGYDLLSRINSGGERPRISAPGGATRLGGRLIAAVGA